MYTFLKKARCCAFKKIFFYNRLFWKKKQVYLNIETNKQYKALDTYSIEYL